MFTENTQNRAYAFVRAIANDCTSCLHRNTENCSPCRSRWARGIFTDMVNEIKSHSAVIDYSLSARILKILSILNHSQNPLLSKSIRIRNLCSNQLKLWTLKNMIQHGLIRRSYVFTANNKKVYQYSITPKGKSYYENHNSRASEC